MNKFMLEIKWGLIFVVVALLWVVYEKAMGWHGVQIDQHATMTNIFAVLAIGIYVLALMEKRRRLHGKMSWLEGFISGMVITLIVVVLSPLSQYVTHVIITPEYFPNIIAYAVESGQVSQADAEVYFTLTNYIIQSSIFTLAIGAVTSAIVAAVLMKKK